MVNHCLENSQINLIPELIVFLHNFSPQNKRIQLVLADNLINSQRELKVIFHPEQVSFFHYMS